MLLFLVCKYTCIDTYLKRGFTRFTTYSYSSILRTRQTSKSSTDASANCTSSTYLLQDAAVVASISAARHEVYRAYNKITGTINNKNKICTRT